MNVVVVVQWVAVRVCVFGEVVVGECDYIWLVFILGQVLGEGEVFVGEGVDVRAVERQSV
jgi:hypothetical protein